MEMEDWFEIVRDLTRGRDVKKKVGNPILGASAAGAERWVMPRGSMAEMLEKNAEESVKTNHYPR